MNRNKPRQQKYQCIRCGYETEQKSNIKRHFYSKQRQCPATLNDIELSDTVKQHIIDNRIYIVPKQASVIQQYNTLNTYIGKLEYSQKLTDVLDYQDKRLLGFDENLESFFENRIKRLEDKSFRAAYVLGQDDIIKLVDEVTKTDRNDLDKSNVIFDKKIKRIRIYQGHEWNSYLEETGVRELVSLIKSYYLDEYEMYLIKNIHSEISKVKNRMALKEHLAIYYRFLAIFDLPIYVFGQTDEEILGHRLVDNNEYYLDEYYTNQYEQHKRSIKDTEKNRVKRKISNIVKDNTIHTISELNALLLDLLQTDDTFKTRVMHKSK